ncbi:MAG TPA: ABC transporter permease [Actinomycetota bacterium]|nr:ABC transporter permease [Actinomycetota bacterium]
MSTTLDPDVAVATSTAPQLGQRISRLWTYRNLLLNLTKRDLRIRYKESFLGFLWTLLNPLMFLVIFYIVFVIIVPQGIPNFVIFFLSGLLPWTMFQNSMMMTTNSVVGGAPLLKRVAFPREVLPLAVIGANIFTFALQLVVLLAVLLALRYNFYSWYLLLTIPAFVVEVLLLVGFALIFSSLTVYLRDIVHFMELATLFWFWVTPVVYPVAQVYTRFSQHHLPFGLVLLNPMVVPILAFQRAFYNAINPLGPVKKAGKVVGYQPVHILHNWSMLWYLKNLGILAIVGVILVWIGFTVFGKAEGNFAEEL